MIFFENTESKQFLLKYEFWRPIFGKVSAAGWRGEIAVDIYCSKR